MARRLTVSLIAASLLVLVAGIPAAAAGVSKRQLSAKALAISDFPTGWSVDNSSKSTDQGCLSSFKSATHQTKVTVSFQDGNFPEVDEVLATGPGAAKGYNTSVKALSHCKTYTVSSGGTTGTVTIGAMSYPPVGQKSAAFALTITAGGLSAGGAVVLFRLGRIFGAVGYEDLGSPDIAQVEKYVTKAVDKVESGSVRG